MAKILNVDDMLVAATESEMPGASDFVRIVETIATGLAHSLANHLGVGTNFADFQPGFGGTCAPFFSIKPDQVCPTVIDQGDVGGDWSDGESLAPQADDAPQSLADALTQCVGFLTSQAEISRARLAQIAAWPVNSNSEPDAMGAALSDIQKLASA